jgi:L-type amino acid transporter 9
MQANIVASEIRDPGHALPKAIKAAMLVVLSSFELVNVAYYVLLPWHQLSASNAVAVSAATSLLGRPAGIVITLLVAISCAGSITSNIFSVGRLTIAASQRSYLPAIFSKRGLLVKKQSAEREVIASTFDAPLYENLLLISILY